MGKILLLVIFLSVDGSTDKGMGVYFETRTQCETARDALRLSKDVKFAMCTGDY